MELKRLKLARKPLFAVPNHLVDQFAKEFIRLYPNANILVVGRDETGKDRNVLMARIATGDWDGVIAQGSRRIGRTTVIGRGYPGLVGERQCIAP